MRRGKPFAVSAIQLMLADAMVTLAGLEPGTSPRSPRLEKQGRSVPLELQRRYDPHEDLWRHRGDRESLGRQVNQSNYLVSDFGQGWLAHVYFEAIDSRRGQALRRISPSCRAFETAKMLMSVMPNGN